MNWLYWSLLSAFFAALTALLAKLGLNHVDANLASAIRASIAAVLTWGIVAAGHTAPLEQQSRSTWIFLLASGCATGASWFCYFHALQSGPLHRVAPVDKLSVPLTMALGVFVLHEVLSTRTIVGALLILAGVSVIATTVDPL